MTSEWYPGLHLYKPCLDDDIFVLDAILPFLHGLVANSASGDRFDAEHLISDVPAIEVT